MGSRLMVRSSAIAIAAVIAVLALPAAAAAQAPLDSAGKVDGIQLVDTTTTQDGVKWDFFRNLDYPCSISGYQTFAVGTAAGSDPSAPAPLWVRMRGGGVGYFNAAGQPQPSAGNKTENDFDTLIGFTEGNDLNQRISALPAGFRTVSVSMCSHDIYAGGDQVDPNNPNLTPDGQPRHTNGLFATKAAIRYVQEHYPTTRTFLHGTSAGSAGTFSVAYSLQLEDRPVSGYVADSGAPNPANEIDQNNAGTSCARGTEALAAISARIHPDLAGHPPDQLIGNGDSTAPVFNIWNKNDTNACGDEQLPCTMSDGSTQVLSGSECREARVSEAIRALPPDRNSVDLKVCVANNNGPPGNCLRHVVTTVKPSVYPNTAPGGPADFNGAIVDWVGQRLADAPPALDVDLRAKKKLKVKRNRTEVGCEAGGYELRTCAVKVDAKVRGKRRVLARGTGEIAPGADSGSATVKLKLTKLGKKKVRRAPRRGLNAKAHLDVGERYTDRTGTATERVRLR
ncbi:MAG: hypothetical protein M9964_13265 [Solirubrobacterales bacterium]|nr:hypothetical protein [Solirubrobacterales bacterium]